jgi:hypothetical protein
MNRSWTIGGCAGVMLLALAACSSLGPAPGGGRHVTQGLATVVAENLYTGCREQLPNLRKTALGRITASDGTVITVPAETAIGSGPQAHPLYSDCEQVRPARLADVDVNRVPLVEVDRDGEVVSGYVVADNYFELYVNGKLVAVDPVPYTPFNSVIVRFRVKRPYTLAVKLVDWEEKLGLGMEWFPPNLNWYTGDGGLIARFSDGTVTDSSWRAQTFYIAPLANPDDVVERGDLRDTTSLGRTHPLAKPPTCQDKCFAVHYDIPRGWQQASFDDRRWPQAFEYTDAEVGISPALISYSRFPDAFAGARWIWSSNLVFDNVVLARKTVR